MISESEESDSDQPDSPQEDSSQVALRYECPVNFSQVTAGVETQSGLDRLTSDQLQTADQELWVIRAPKDFDPKCLSGQTVKLHKGTTFEAESGSKYDVQVTKNTQHLQDEGLSLLLPSTQDGRLANVPSMHGEISIMQSVAVPSVTIPPPTAPLNTQLPQGLRPRFRPFGWRVPKSVNGHVPVQRRDPDQSDSKKKKKKRKHENKVDADEVDSPKKSKTEQTEVNTERLPDNVEDISTSTEVEDRPHKKKKKKKDKHKEEEAVENVVEDVLETPDSKKKKKKKKDKERESSGDDVQNTVASDHEEKESEVPKKKKKKKKSKDNELV